MDITKIKNGKYNASANGNTAKIEFFRNARYDKTDGKYHSGWIVTVNGETYECIDKEQAFKKAEQQLNPMSINLVCPKCNCDKWSILGKGDFLCLKCNNVSEMHHMVKKVDKNIDAPKSVEKLIEFNSEALERLKDELYDPWSYSEGYAEGIRDTIITVCEIFGISTDNI